jgi:hypothetical protein
MFLNGTTNAPNVIVNGNFQDFSVGQGWTTTNTAYGWNGTLDIAYAPIFNPNWPISQVAQVDVKKGGFINQTLLFTDSLRNVPNPLLPPINSASAMHILSFKYAAAENRSLSSSSGEVYFNNVLMGKLQPTDYLVNAFSCAVSIVAGNNNLHFKATGSDKVFGLTLDNVTLSPKNNATINYVLNGDF